MCGVTTEACLHATVRKADECGDRCVVLADACASHLPTFHEAGLVTIEVPNGIFGPVAEPTA